MHSFSPKKYAEQVLDSIRFYSLPENLHKLDSLEALLESDISDTTSKTNLILKLEKLIKAIDRHNYIMLRDRYREMETGETAEMHSNPYPFRGKLLKGKYAYICLDGFIGVDSVSADNYTDSLQRIVSNLYQQDPRGWIIDLRDNSGGWVYPMIAGLGPILGRGIKAYEIEVNGRETEYYYVKNDTTYLQLTDSIYIMEDSLPVAVLVSNNTGSAGELLALCFRGNPKTTLIGQPTYGISTGLTGFFMPDSIFFAVTNSRMTDRFKVGDGKSIVPDFVTKDALQSFEKACEWIETNRD